MTTSSDETPQSSVKKDLFEDLRSRNITEIKKEIVLLDKEIAELTQRFDALGHELNNAAGLEALLSDIMDNDEYKTKSKEAKKIAKELKATHGEISNFHQIRNRINEHVGLPSHRCEDELLRVYKRLTGEVDVFKVPSIEREEQLFSYFFELQEMYKRMLEADEAHEQAEKLFKKQQDNLKKMKSLNSEISASFDSAIDDEVTLEGVELNYSSLMEIRKSIYNLKKLRSKSFRIRKKARYIQHSEKPKQKPRKERRKGPSSAEVKEKVSSGSSLSLQELDVFLKSGGLKSLESKKSESASVQRKKKKQKPSVQVARGKPAKSSKGIKD
ncbi:MAG: hypothetical protein VW270_28250 [Candidatus Poseidoniales archaeon]